MDKIQNIISQMTLEEKAALCTGATAWNTTPLEHLGVPKLYVSDGPHGPRRVADADSMAMESLAATCFPTASCTASSWNLDLIHEMGQAIAEKAITLNVDVLLGPGTNMKRSPVCGRNFEYFSEDPYLAGEMAASFINGVQSQGVGTSLKHYAVNNQETRRMMVNAEVDERTLRAANFAALIILAAIALFSDFAYRQWRFVVGVFIIFLMLENVRYTDAGILGYARGYLARVTSHSMPVRVK